MQTTRMKAVVAMSVAIVFVAGSMVYFSSSQNNQKLATVGKTSISKQDISKEVENVKLISPTIYAKDFKGADKDKLETTALDALIDKRLLLDEAKKQGIHVNEQKVTRAFDIFKKSYPNQTEFDDVLKKAGMTEADLKDALADNLTIQELAEKLVPDSAATDKKLKDYFDKHKEEFAQQNNKRVSQILFKSNDMKTVQEVSTQLSSGADFALLAKKYSQDGRSGTQGGDLGWITPASYPKEFQGALATLTKGAVSKPFSTTYGIHILKLTDTRSQSQSFKSVKDQIKVSWLSSERTKAIDDLVEKLKKETKIEIK